MQFLLNNFIRISEKNVMHTPRIPVFCCLGEWKNNANPQTSLRRFGGLLVIQILKWASLPLTAITEGDVAAASRLGNKRVDGACCLLNGHCLQNHMTGTLDNRIE